MRGVRAETLEISYKLSQLVMRHWQNNRNESRKNIYSGDAGVLEGIHDFIP